MPIVSVPPEADDEEDEEVPEPQAARKGDSPRPAARAPPMPSI
jgi:hypothetical protein